ncbi:riboflavin synthase [Candidatus Neomarinimicrobiota bacterium]
MFTGIVEEKGQVISRTPGNGYDELVISCVEVLADLSVGHSIAVNGVCLTAVKIDNEHFSAQVINETLERSNLSALEAGSTVNLERAMGITDRFHGHIVQGHVETVGVVTNLHNQAGDVRMSIAVDGFWLRYCIPKGSVTLDGISLTIASMDETTITVALIPHTLHLTTLGDKQVGDQINIETDMLARYIERLFEVESMDEEFVIDYDKIRGWGYGES